LGDWWHKRGASGFFQDSIENFKINVRLKINNQTLIDPDHIFNQDRDRDENFLIKVCLKNFNQSLLKIFQSRSGCKKVNHMYANPRNHSPSEDCTGARFFN
jgi:hypothetical protein